MPPIFTGRAVLCALALLAAAGPAFAEGGGYPGPGFEPDLRPHPYGPPRYAPARALPPETRYRDPRYRPVPPRPLPRLGPPTELIQAYLPRNTERPMYNEPPSRFPGR